MADRALLETRLAELRARLERIETDLAEPLNADSSEQAVEMEDDVPLEAQAALVRSQIAPITRALDRIADGSYGRCVLCGADIPAARLEARPEASLCIDCASKAA